MRLPIHSLAFGCTPRGEALLGRQGLKQEAAASAADSPGQQ
jgi:hypothetical protein